MRFLHFLLLLLGGLLVATGILVLSAMSYHASPGLSLCLFLIGVAFAAGATEAAGRVW